MALIILYTRRGFPFTPKQVCILAYEMAQSKGRRGFSPVKNTIRTWFKYLLYQNQKVKAKMSQDLSIFHAMGANKVQINKLCDELREWIRMWKLEYSPNSIWNVDECSLGDVPKSQKVVDVNGEQPFQTVTDEKAKTTTLLNYISAGGVAMKPMIIFKNAAIKRMERDNPFWLLTESILQWVHQLKDFP